VFEGHRACALAGWGALVAALVFVAGCGADDVAPPPAAEDGGLDASTEAGPIEAGPADAGVDLGACGDEDGDGARSAACGGTDCDDANPARYPGATEVCDAADLDEDCDPDTYGFRDSDGDGYPDARCCNGLTCGDDCNDMRPGVNPAVPEVCNDVDDDCDGTTDEDLLVMVYTDADRDGFGAGRPTPGCPGAPGTVTNGDDCDDDRASTNPAAMEACDGTADDDCDGTVDEGCACVTGATRSCGSDVGECVAGTQSCIGGAWGSCTAVVPATETCNGLDDDCDGDSDEGLLALACFVDGDADGFGVGVAGPRCADPMRAAFDGCPIGTTNLASPADCDDARSAVNPAVLEVCDGLRDDDCDGVVDDGCECTNGTSRSCGSDEGACVAGVQNCVTGAWTGCPAVGPTAETCNGVDDDCDAMTDEGLLVGGCYLDRDADGYGAGAATTQCLDSSRVSTGTCPAGYTNLVAPIDCNDSRADTSPVATEFCDGLDNNCDGAVDNVAGAGAACTVGVGACAVVGVRACSGATLACMGAPGVPGAEVCNGIDDDCDGAADDGIELLFDCRRDVDGDGFGVGEPTTQCPDPSRLAFGRCPVGYTSAPELDCNDASIAIRPAATEACNGIDDDCDGFIDDVTPTLSALTISCGTLGPTFDPATTAYRVVMPLGTTSCVVQATVECPSASTLTTDGLSAMSGVGVRVDVPVSAFAWPLSVRVTAANGAARSYDVALVRSSLFFKASNTGDGDKFGYSIALSEDGSTLAVGAPREDSAATGIGGDQTSNAASDSGAVYVFRRSAGVWAQEAYLKASNTGGSDPIRNGGDEFGTSVTLSADGSALAVGAYLEDSAATGVGGDQMSNAASDSGAVYVFHRTMGVWAQEAYIKASNTDRPDGFGWSVALSADGSALAVGAYKEASVATGIGGDQTSNTAGGSGAVYVFRRAAGVWTQEAYVKASNTNAGDRFGWSLGLSADGAALAVAAPGEDSSATGIGGSQTSNGVSDAGAVYVFRRAAGVWGQEAYVKAARTASIDEFGWAIALTADGSALAVGVLRDSSAATGIGGDPSSFGPEGTGAVYVFRRTAGVWAQEAYVKASVPYEFDAFGTSVAFSADGSALAVGAIYEDSAATGIGGDQTNAGAILSGAAYVFRRTAGVWAQEAYVKASNTGPNDFFGAAVALSADGGVLAVGAQNEDAAATGIGGNQANDDSPNSGAVYVY
jgi:hypothetical protein